MTPLRYNIEGTPTIEAVQRRRLDKRGTPRPSTLDEYGVRKPDMYSPEQYEQVNARMGRLAPKIKATHSVQAHPYGTGK